MVSCSFVVARILSSTGAGRRGLVRRGEGEDFRCGSSSQTVGVSGRAADRRDRRARRVRVRGRRCRGARDETDGDAFAIAALVVDARAACSCESFASRQEFRDCVRTVVDGAIAGATLPTLSRRRDALRAQVDVAAPAGEGRVLQGGRWVQRRGVRSAARTWAAARGRREHRGRATTRALRSRHTDAASPTLPTPGLCCARAGVDLRTTRGCSGTHQCSAPLPGCLVRRPVRHARRREGTARTSSSRAADRAAAFRSRSATDARWTPGTFRARNARRHGAGGRAARVGPERRPAPVPVLPLQREGRAGGLDWKGVRHERRTHLPGPHGPLITRLSGQTQTPVLLIDGAVVAGSQRILDERRLPGRPLFPARRCARRRPRSATSSTARSASRRAPCCSRS